MTKASDWISNGILNAGEDWCNLNVKATEGLIRLLDHECPDIKLMMEGGPQAGGFGGGQYTFSLCHTSIGLEFEVKCCCGQYYSLGGWGEFEGREDPSTRKNLLISKDEDGTLNYETVDAEPGDN